MSTKAPAQRAHWHDAYDAQMALWRWYRTPDSADWVRGCIRGAFPGGNPELIVRLWDGEMGRLLDCDPIYVSEEMCEVVDAARHAFIPEPLLETDLITPRGFMWFARPFEMPDRLGAPLSVRAASWAREYASTSEEDARVAMERLHSVSAWSRGERIRPDEMEELIDEGLFFPFGINITLYADRDHYLFVTNDEGDRREIGGAHYSRPDWVEQATASVPVVPFHATPWHFNQTFAGNEVDLDDKPTSADEWWRTLQTTFRLMQQRLATRHMERPHRAHRREAKRLGLPYEPEVVVVRLRREQGERHDPTGEEANYSHRFIVSGHWRNQPYPSEGIHRQIWISPYVKGPEDKPLIVRPRRVFQWER